MSKVTLKPDDTTSKALQVYDDVEKKVVDMPEEEVKNTEDMMRVFTGIQEVWWSAYKEKISEHNFTSGLLRFAISFIEKRLKESGKSTDSWLNEEAGKIWDSIGPKIDKLVEDSGALDCKERKETDEEILVLDALAFCFIARAFDICTPKFWRSDAIAAKIREKDQARVEKEKAIAEKEKAKAEKRVPVGN